MRALVICHEDTVGAGFVEQRLRERGFDLTVHVVVRDPQRPDLASPFPDRRGHDLVVAMGSTFSVYDIDTIGAWIGDEIEFLRQAHHAGTPVLGICFGGQALAKALGGGVLKAEVTELGWYEIAPTHRGAPFPVGPWLEWHHDCFTVPAEAELLASTPAAPQLFRLGKSLGTQFHPEISVELMTGWLSMAPDEYLAEHGVNRDDLLAGVVRHEAQNRVNCYALVDWFLAEVAELEPAEASR